MREPTLQQLSDVDAVFLSMETDRSWGHVGGLSVLDASECPDFGYERLVEFVEKRIRLVPRYTWRLQEVPLGLDQPYWVVDEELDVREHIHRIAAPSPGGMKEVAELAGQLFAGPLDRSRALWEMWLIEGLEDGRYAMFMKYHHCLMDGQASAGLAEVLADLQPDATAPPIVPDHLDLAPPRPPTGVEQAWNAVRNEFSRGSSRLGHAADALRSGLAGLLRERDEFDPPAVGDVPQLPFNTSVGARRGFACTSVSLPRVKAVKKHFGVTVNDVLLALVASALRWYLTRRGALPEKPISAFLPVSLRSQDDGSVDNQVTAVPVSLATDVVDPVDRLQRIHACADRAKDGVGGSSMDMVSALAESLAPVSIGFVMRLVEGADVGVPIPANIAVSNVRGTPVPLYSAGARIESMYPMSVLATGHGLNVTAVSYMDRIDVGLTFDPALVPDAWALAEDIYAALEELEKSVEETEPSGLAGRERHGASAGAAGRSAGSSK